MVARDQKLSHAAIWEGVRSDYRGAKHSRFMRNRNVPSGASADYHVKGETEYLRIMEYARDMVRNDLVIGPAVDKLVTQVVQGGFSFDPKTGSDELDDLLKDKWEAWANDEQACDYAGEMTFVEMEEQVLRATVVDGDILVIPMDGKMMLVEGHRCRTPSNTKQDVVLGVKLEQSTRRRMEFWISKEDVNPLGALSRVRDIQKYAAYDLLGDRNVIHVADPKRVSQTRGVSLLAPIFISLGMLEDLHLAKLVQQQAVSSYAILRERDATKANEGKFTPGKNDITGNDRRRAQMEAGEGPMVSKVGPGMVYSGAPGETLKGFSPGVPNAEYFEQVKQLLQFAGQHLHLPLVLLMMDGSETNFSGWRGAVDTARMEFRRVQQFLIRRFHNRVACQKIRDWMDSDAQVRDLIKTLTQEGKPCDPMKHNWNPPRWTYVQPLQDAQAHALRKADMQVSPRAAAAELSLDHKQLVEDTVADNAFAITQAVEAWTAFKEEYPDVAVTWRDFLYVSAGERVLVAAMSAGKEPGEQGQDADGADDNQDGKSNTGRKRQGKREAALA